MSGDATQDDVEIPSVFMTGDDAQRLRHLLTSGEEEVFVLLTWIRTEEGESKGEGEGEGVAENLKADGGQSSLYDSGNGGWTEDMALEQNQKSSRPSSSHSSSEKSSH